MKTRDLLNLTRMHTANWEAFVFVVGPLVVRVSIFSWQGATLACLGVLINCFIFVLNDLADLPRDRLNPLRSNSPLVSGAISPAFALLLSCALPIVMWLLIALSAWPAAAEVSFAALVLLGAYLDVYQKTARRVHPLLLDLLFAVCMAGPIPVGVLSVDRSMTSTVWAITVAFGLLCLGLNTIGGNLKDLASDQETGFRTTAIALGVRAVEGRPQFSAAYRRYLLVLTAATTVSLLIASTLASQDRSPAARVAVGVAVLSCCLGMGMAVGALASGRRSPAPRGRERSFGYGMAAMIIVIAAAADFGQLVFALLVVGVAELFFRIYWRSGEPSPWVDGDA